MDRRVLGTLLLVSIAGLAAVTQAPAATPSGVTASFNHAPAAPVTGQVVAFPAPRPEKAETIDSGKVRMGMLSPSFPAPRTEKAETTDSGKVRMGMLSPSFPAPRSEKTETADNGKVRMGNLSPAL